MIRSIFVALFVWASAATAQSLPALYDVSGVASDDVLNVRLTPSASGDLIGRLPHDAKNIEVVRLSDDGRWAWVNINENSGWASTRYLTLIADSGFLPASNLNCYGTEPFWSLQKPQTGTITSSILGEDFEQWEPVVSHRSHNHINRFSIIGEWEGRGMVLTLSREICSDGMSDQVFGIAAEYIRNGADMGHLSGCCSVSPN